MMLAIDLESVKRLTNLADINRALHETHARERSIEAELEELLSKRTAIEETFVTLHDSASEVRLPCSLSCPGITISLQQHLYCKMSTHFMSPHVPVLSAFKLPEHVRWRDASVACAKSDWPILGMV